VLVVGSSTGYGLASRIVPPSAAEPPPSAYSSKRSRPTEKTASAGWYNSAAFETAAKAAGLYARSFNGDAFSNEMKQQIVEAIKPISARWTWWSTASPPPDASDPNTGEIFKSVLKPTGVTYTNKNINTDKAEIDFCHNRTSHPGRNRPDHQSDGRRRLANVDRRAGKSRRAFRRLQDRGPIPTSGLS